MKFPAIKLYNLITAPIIPTDVLWDLSTLFVVLAIIYFSAIFVYRNKFKKAAADTSMRKKILAPMVSEFLFYEEKAGTKEEKNSYINRKVEIRELIKDKKNEIVLAEILLDLKKDVSGETRDLLFKLYKDLNLENQAFEKIKSFKWQKISQGMFELTQMQVLESYSFISRFINDKRSVVRKQAEISTVTLMNEGISYFLDTTKYQISEWQQLKILEVLSNIAYFEPPRFNKWLTSKNKHVVLFSLRLIKHYDQNDAEESIISLVRHRNNNIKDEAIGCIKKFNFTKSRSTLKAVFWGNNVNIKLAILDAIANIGGIEDIPFLESVDKLESNFTVKSKALSSINTIHPEYIMPSDDLEKIVLEEIKLDNTEDIKEEESIATEVKSLIIEKVQEETEDNSDPENLTEASAPKLFFLEELELNQEIEKLASCSEDDLFDKTIEDQKEDVWKEPTEVESSLDNVTVIDTPNIVLTEDITDNEIEKETSNNFAPEAIITIDESIGDDSIVDSKEKPNELPESYQSIFKSLFEKADDECKLLLLDEILEIGNSKEISFLASLHNHHNAVIRSKALIIKSKLQENLTVIVDDDTESILTPEEQYVKPQLEKFHFIQEIIKDDAILDKKEEKESSYKKTDDLMPLEFCFLLGELEINPAKPFDLFEIEFAPEFSEDKNILNDNIISNDEYSHINGLTAEENNYFQQLLEFPLTIKDKYNG